MNNSDFSAKLRFIITTDDEWHITFDIWPKSNWQDPDVRALLKCPNFFVFAANAPFIGSLPFFSFLASFFSFSKSSFQFSKHFYWAAGEHFLFSIDWDNIHFVWRCQPRLRSAHLSNIQAKITFFGFLFLTWYNRKLPTRFDYGRGLRGDFSAHEYLLSEARLFPHCIIRKRWVFAK